MFLIVCSTSGSQNTQKHIGITKLHLGFKHLAPDPLPRPRSLQIGHQNDEPNPLSRLENNPHAICEKAAVSLVISECALEYSGLDSSICPPKIRIRCHQTVPRCQKNPGGAYPRTHLARLPRFIFA